MTRARLVLVVGLFAGCGQSAAAPPDAGGDAPLPCDPDAATGLQHALPLTVNGVVRHFMLYVPTTYRCDGPGFPLVIDFHGTWTGTEADNGEEFYALDGLVAQAEAQGFVVARPRSLYSTVGAVNTYRWDENPGDLATNAFYAHELVAHLSGAYHVDPARVYAAGFSSGTGMIAQFLADDPQVFHGYGYVGGGYWPGEEPHAVHLGTAPIARTYAVSGYRDYLYPNQQLLFTLLAAQAYPHDHLFQRTDTNGHELYGWHYREMFRWLDAGVRPDTGTLTSAWTAEPVPDSQDLTAISSDGAGGLLASGSHGGVFRRDPVSGWSTAATVAGSPALSAICVQDSGTGIAAGDEHVVRTTDHGHTWSTATFPAFVPNYFAQPFINAVGCSATKLVGVGYWDAGHSTDGGQTWAATAAPSTPAATYASQGAQVKVSAAGTWIASGYYDYVGRSTDGVTFVPVAIPVDVQWIMGIATAPGGHWWVVGEAGTLLASVDDGLTWTVQTVPTVEDLYAVAFFDAQRGVAVGAHGAAMLTTDGGATWTDRSTGLDAFLGDVVWLDRNTVLVVGGDGTAATSHVD